MTVIDRWRAFLAFQSGLMAKPRLRVSSVAQNNKLRLGSGLVIKAQARLQARKDSDSFHLETHLIDRYVQHIDCLSLSFSLKSLIVRLLRLFLLHWLNLRFSNLRLFFLSSLWHSTTHTHTHTRTHTCAHTHTRVREYTQTLLTFLAR